MSSLTFSSCQDCKTAQYFWSIARVLTHQKDEKTFHEALIWLCKKKNNSKICSFFLKNFFIQFLIKNVPIQGLLFFILSWLVLFFVFCHFVFISHLKQSSKNSKSLCFYFYSILMCPEIKKKKWSTEIKKSYAEIGRET